MGKLGKMLDRSLDAAWTEADFFKVLSVVMLDASGLRKLLKATRE
jgi:hypothetical protein